MEKRLVFSIALLMVLLAFVPAISAEEPTREGDAEILEVMLDGFVGPSGEYASGIHTISVRLNNTGNGEFISWVDFFINVTFESNDTVFHYEMVTEMVYIPNGSQTTIDLVDLDLIEDTFNILVNATIGASETMAEIPAEVLDVIDIGVMGLSFEEDSYPLGEDIIPRCNVSYDGNVFSFADDVEVGLVIGMPGETPVYDESIQVLTVASPGQDPGTVWPVSFPAWTPDTPGSYEAVFSVNYDIYNELNNIDMKTFEIDNPPSIQGWVTTDDEDPIPGVEVTVSTAPELTATTDADGYYSFFDVPEGTYNVSFYMMWVSEYFEEVTVVEGETQIVNATLTPLNICGLRGEVDLPDGAPASGALVVVTISGYPLFTVNTNSTGYYEFEELPAENATVTASLSGYVDDEKVKELASQTWNELDLKLGEEEFSVSFSVPDGEPGFPVFDSIAVFFTRQIDRDSVDQGSLVLRKLTTGTVVSVFYTFDDDDYTVIMTPEDPLDYSTDYQLEVTSWITDINGDYFPGPVVITFTTEAEITTIELLTFYPGDDENEVPLDAVINAKFPVPMDGTTINMTTFILSAPGGVRIDGAVTYQASTYTAYFTPSQNLEYETRYSVSLDPDIKASDPSNIFEGFTWSFETKVLVTTGAVAGIILDENGEPFLPSQVTIEVKKGLTDSKTKQPQLDGSFEITDLEAGKWTMTVTVNGYKAYTTEIDITAGETYTITNPIRLVKEEKDGGDDNNNQIIWIIVIIFLVVLIVLIGIWLWYSKREEPVEAEEIGRRPHFGGRREPSYAGAGYDEYTEGEFLCPQCGSVVEGEDTICPACGAEFEEDLFECPECGASIPGDAMECPDCGATFEEEEETGEEEDFYGEEEEEIDITEDYEVEDLDEDELPISHAE
ncbi:MAG: carboxypeptidase regulatory-like domain-containing protein [Thermoplasmatota archaeon]